MELHNVKLVISDMDGTLLNSRGEVSQRFFKLYHHLRDHVHFVAASGRQFQSIENKLNSIANQITIVAENGGLARNNGNELLFTRLPGEHLNTIINTAGALPNVEIVLCGKSGAYIDSKDDTFINTFQEYYHEFSIVDDLKQVDASEIMKVALYHHEDSEAHIYPNVKALSKDLLVKVSGQNWVDISHPEANKGKAIALIQEHMGISKEETMVFGDYNNDLEMLERAYFSYAMKNAHPLVKQTARFETGSNDEEGVEDILEQLVKAKSLVG